MKKLLTAFILVALVGLLGISFVSADTGVFQFREIEVDGVEVFPTGTDQVIYVERGETTDIRVEFVLDDADPATQISDDRVRVKAWIGGFEFGDVTDRTDIFTVEEGITYVKHLSLDIPDDIELDDDEFRLHIEIFGNDDYETEETFKLGVRKDRHSVELVSRGIIFYPGNTVEAGRALRTVVRLENLGEQKEEDIFITVRIPELGVSTSTFIDELVPDETTNDDGEETSDSTNDMILYIPADAQSGEYLVEIEVEYNRGHDTFTEKRTILVEGMEEPSSDVEAITSVDITSQDVTADSETAYKVMIANLGNQRLIYSVELTGVEGWGLARTTPSFISVDSNQAGEIFLYIQARESAPLGPQVFTAKILADGVAVKELNLNANIVESTGEPTTSKDNFQRGLEVGFIILVIILIILGLAIAFRRVGEKKQESAGEEPETVEGQTYY